VPSVDSMQPSCKDITRATSGMDLGKASPEGTCNVLTGSKPLDADLGHDAACLPGAHNGTFHTQVALYMSFCWRYSQKWRASIAATGILYVLPIPMGVFNFPETGVCYRNGINFNLSSHASPTFAVHI
jgi:hypothetical protein